MNTVLGELNLDHVIDLCQELVAEFQKIEGGTFGEMLFVLTVTVVETLALKGAPRAAQHFEAGMKEPLRMTLNADPNRTALYGQAILNFTKTLNETDVNDLPAICALCASKIAEVACGEAKGAYITRLWKETLLIAATERVVN